MAAGELRLRGLRKTFADATAVEDLDLDIGAGEFFSLLGSSGCGKTTTLRMIAGFEEPDKGQILLDGRDLTNAPPHRRPVNTVFQSYALFPFLTVWDNVAFGLRYQSAGKQDSRRRIGAALELVQLASYAKRKPHQLSGGQQQRVALARALVLEPTVLLLDEPLGALDAKLRKQLQGELRSIQKSVGTTFVYVTHDQEEALTMSDRLAVLRDGRVEQVGTPSQVYSFPTTAYVAGFIGTANLYDGVVDKVSEGLATCRVGSFEIRARARDGVTEGAEVSITLRPERVELFPPTATHSAEGNFYQGVVSRLVFLGSQTQVVLQVGDCAIVAELPNIHGEPPSWLCEAHPLCIRISTDAAQLLRRDSSVGAAAPADPLH
ncbi:MAG: ABC transporter ATP-binding protein [Nocardioidaceae bacterium]